MESDTWSLRRYGKAVAFGVSLTLMAVVLSAPVQAAEPASHLVISGIEPAGSSTDTEEYVELYNPTASPIDVTGLKLTVRDGAGKMEQKNLMLNARPTTLVEPGGYYLLTSESAPLASRADATYSTTGLTLSDNGSVSIQDQAGTTLDMVGWGMQPTGGYETKPVGLNPAVNQGLVRKPGAIVANQGNGLDADNNADDFTLINNPTLRSSSDGQQLPQLPTSPEAVTARADQAGAVHVTWLKSADDKAGGMVTGYNVWRRTANESSSVLLLATLPAGSEMYHDATTKAGTGYFYKIEALSSAYSAFSPETSIVVADDSQPVITPIAPTEESYTSSRSLTIVASLDEGYGVGVDPATIVVWVDKAVVPHLFDGFRVSAKVDNLTEGTHTITIKAADKAGNSAEKSWHETVDTMAPTLSLILTRLNGLQATVVLGATDGPAGLASGVKDMQIAFDGTLDTESWQPFQLEVMGELASQLGTQTIVARVRDRADNVSEMAQAHTDVLTTSPLMPPAHAISSTVGNTVTITWPTVTGATQYVVRYSDGKILYGPLLTDQTSIVIPNLDSTKMYNFEVASTNSAGVITGFTRVLPPELIPALATSQSTSGVAKKQSVTTAEKEQVAGTPLPSESPTPAKLETKPTPSPVATLSPSPSPTPGSIKGGEENQARDWTRVIVALSILIIAAGVATGGWYLYQWWLTRPKSPNKGGRW